MKFNLNYEDAVNDYLDSAETSYQKTYKQHLDEKKVDRKKEKKTKHNNDKRKMLDMLE